VATSCRVNPVYTPGEAGVIAIEDKVGITANDKVPEIRVPAELRVAVIVVVPTATPVAIPDTEIVAFEVSDELQATELEISAVVPSE